MLKSIIIFRIIFNYGDKMIRRILIIFFIIEIIFINNCISDINNNNTSSDEVVLIKKVTTPVEDDKTQQIQPTAISIQKTNKENKNNTNIMPQNTPVANKEKISFILNKLKENKKDNVAMYADVILKTYYGKQEPQIVKGSLIVKRNNKFKIHYIEPTEQFLISNGKVIWIYTPELKQVIKQNPEESQMGSNFYIELESSIEYYVNQSKTSIKEDEKSYMLIMYPKNKKIVNFDKMVIKINKDKFIPEYMGMLYQSVVTRVYFNNVRYYSSSQTANIKELNDSNFEFVVPEGVEEIDASLISEIK
jgi:outer membrane lipoprotein carrier protein